MSPGNENSTVASVEPKSGYQFVAAIGIVIFTIEVAVMLGLGWDELSVGTVMLALFDASLLTACVSPILHYCVVKPFVTRAHQAESKLAETLRAKEAQSVELAAALARLETQKFVLDQQVIVSETDVNGRITYANPEFCRISGYTKEELIGQSHSVVKSGHHPPEFWREMYATIARGAVWRAEVCNKAKDGSLYWVKATNAAVKDPGGTITGYVSVRSDITQTVRRELALKRTQAQLFETATKAKAASVAKSNFLSTMSHEMRTPLNGVVGALELLRKTVLNKEQSELVDIAVQSSEALLVHINDVLDFSKMEAGKLELDKKPFDLGRMVKSVLDIVASQAKDRANGLESEFKGELPHYLVGDRDRVRQVLLNLVSNANKFTRDGRITVRIERAGGTDEQPEIEIGVFDTGIGIPEDRLKDLFQEFSMVDSSLTRKTGGTGLGLAISKRLVEAMGGTVGVNSVLGEGSHFWFKLALPASSEMSDVDMKPAADAPISGVSKLKVLLADDNPTNQIVASRMLIAAGHDVVTVNNGREALEAARAERYDIILMDVSMPEMDGMEATRKIRELPEPFRTVPIVAVTASAIAGDRERILAAGMNDYLAKPLRRAELEACLARIAPARTMEAVADPAAPETAAEVKLPPLVDVGALEALAAETSPDVVALVIDEYLKETKRRLDEVAAAMQARNTAELERVAHAIAGASASTGARRLWELAARVEKHCKAGSSAEALHEAEALPSVMERTNVAFRTHVEKSAGAGGNARKPAAA